MSYSINDHYTPDCARNGCSHALNTPQPINLPYYILDASLSAFSRDLARTAQVICLRLSPQNCQVSITVRTAWPSPIPYMGILQFSNTGPYISLMHSRIPLFPSPSLESSLLPLRPAPPLLDTLTRPTVEMSDTAAASVEINDALFCQSHLKEIVRTVRFSCVGPR